MKINKPYYAKDAIGLGLNFYFGKYYGKRYYSLVITFLFWDIEIEFGKPRVNKTI